jgi:hypothetical protein
MEDMKRIEICAQAPIPWDRDVWLAKVESLSWAVDELRHWEASAITRRDVARRAMELLSDGVRAEAAARLLVSVFVWGYGNNARGRVRTVDVLRRVDDPQGGQRLAELTRLAMMDGVKAYQLGIWRGRRSVIDGFGTSFGTKYAFFASFAGQPRVRPLIYDQFVAKALVASQTYQVALRRAREEVGSRRRAMQVSPWTLRTFEYRVYLEYARAQAARQGVSPDCIEMLLFEQGKLLSAARRSPARHLGRIGLR